MRDRRHRSTRTLDLASDANGLWNAVNRTTYLWSLDAILLILTPPMLFTSFAQIHFFPHLSLSKSNGDHTWSVQFSPSINSTHTHTCPSLRWGLTAHSHSHHLCSIIIFFSFYFYLLFYPFITHKITVTQASGSREGNNQVHLREKKRGKRGEKHWIQLKVERTLCLHHCRCYFYLY